MSPEHSGDTALKLGNVAKLGSGRVEIRGRDLDHRTTAAAAAAAAE
jgi:hypothetical protein